MKTLVRKIFCFLLASFLLGCIPVNFGYAQDIQQHRQKPDKGQKTNGKKLARLNIDDLTGNIVLSSPTDSSIVINVITVPGMEIFVEYTDKKTGNSNKTKPQASPNGGPLEIDISNLKPNTTYNYRLNIKAAGETQYKPGSEHSFNTQRSASSAFSFGVQGDSHPERTGKMFNPELYRSTMNNVSQYHPDFYFMLGDDFSIENLIDQNQISQKTVDEVYLYQRQYVGAIACNSPLFLVNGNHEQAAKYLLDGSPVNPAVCAANARVKYYTQPSPGSFYSGDEQEVKHVGLLKDYYAFEWGNALFVVIDPYWHSDSAVDNNARNEGKRKDLWNNTLGKEQYEWFRKTLESSKAKYKFVFSHHVLGTGRGGTEQAKLYEWGGYDKRGKWEFEKMRPGWQMPIHQLMVKNKVTIFFQGHDHIFAKQELDGIVYQSVPNPADPTYSTFNANSYTSGAIFPNSGFLNVTVSPQQVKVDYIRTFLTKDESPENKNGSCAYSYILK